MCYNTNYMKGIRALTFCGNNEFCIYLINFVDCAAFKMGSLDQKANKQKRHEANRAKKHFQGQRSHFHFAAE